MLLDRPPPYLKYSEFRPDIYHTADCREIFWQGEETKRLKHHPAPLNDMWGRGYSTIEQYRCGIDLVTRYPVTLSVLQYLTGNENADHELELFKLFLTQNSGDINELESSFGFLESMISASCVDKSNLIYMIKEMYPDLYHFVTDVMPFVVVDEKSFDDGVFSVSYDTARKNACGLKLIRQLHKTVNGSNNSI